MKKTRALLALLGLFLAGSLEAESKPAGISLPQVVDLVLRGSPDLHASAARMEGTNAAWREARARQWPRLTGRSAFTRGDNPVYVFGSLLEQGQFGASNFAINSLNRPGYVNNVQSALDLGIPLFSAFQVRTQKELSRLQWLGAKTQNQGLIQRTRFEAVETYLQVLVNREMLQAIQERIASATLELGDADRLRKKGLVLGSDYYAAQATVSGLKAWQVRLESALEAAQSRLAILTGIEPGAILPTEVLTESLAALEPEAKWQADALSARQDLEGAFLQEQASEAARRQAYWSALPTVEAFGSLETDTQDFSSNPTNRLIGVRASLPIGDPSYGPRMASAHAREDLSREQKKEVRQKIQLDVAQAWRSLQGTLESLPIVQQSLDQARHSLKLFQPLYREGRQSVLEVARAEEGLARAHTGYLQTLYDLHLGMARLELAAGRLDQASVVELERQLKGTP